MRLIAIALVLSAAPAAADAWQDLAQCSKPGKRISIIAARTKDGTRMAMPMPNVGGRGFTREERCLITAIAKLPAPALPDEVSQVTVRYTIGDPPPSFDVAETVEVFAKRTALAACDRKARTVRLVLDVARGKPRVWMPAWQFHSPKGDGSTPPAQQQVKACLTKAIRGWTHSLPAHVGELQLALAVSP